MVTKVEFIITSVTAMRQRCGSGGGDGGRDSSSSSRSSTTLLTRSWCRCRRWCLCLFSFSSLYQKEKMERRGENTDEVTMASQQQWWQ